MVVILMMSEKLFTPGLELGMALIFYTSVATNGWN